MDDIKYYKPLSVKDMSFIVDHIITNLNIRLTDQHIKINVDQDVKEWIAKEAYEPNLARPLKRFVQRQIETP